VGSVVLLDTNVLLHLLQDPTGVQADARALVASPDTEVLVSAISAFEIAQKVRIGKLEDMGILASWREVLQQSRLVEVPLTGEQLIDAGTMVWENRDPFDRMIIAQARSKAATLVTRDRIILESGLVSVVAA
jgi:PIN domain nuclease of toxin-antitoxin system